MKYLLSLILFCALLCGCGQSKPLDERLSPTESVVGEFSAPEEFGGRIRNVPLNLQEVQGFHIFEDDILLFSGQERTMLTLLDGKTLETLAHVSLEHPLAPEDSSLVLHPAGRLSFYDPCREETVLLDSRLQEVARIPAPGGLSGHPILSEDETTLFYCTTSHIRAWNLDSNIQRCVKEMAFSEQKLTGVHMGAAVLQCQIMDEGQTITLFLSAEDGRLLHQGTDRIALTTQNGCYFARVSAGTYRIPVFGTDPDFPIMLAPEDPAAQVFFLPKQMAAVTATTEIDQIRLNYCQLPAGQPSHQLALAPGQIPMALEYINDDLLLLLILDSHTGQSSLFFWDVREPASLDAGCTALPYRIAASPDTAGLARCRQQAQRLGDRYGIRILLGEEAAAAKPWGLLLEPEHLVPILQWELTQLEQRLASYPESLLQEMAAQFSSLNLCLVRSLSGFEENPAAQGAHFLDGQDAYVVIPTGSGSAQALYHQLFHLMEIHIFSESKAFDRWSTLNPAGFQYDYDYAANLKRDSGVYLFEESRAFVDTFSMSYPKEDRARIMEYAMLPNYEALFRPPAMQKKLRQLCTGIRDAYGLEDQDEPFLWEQYLQ